MVLVAQAAVGYSQYLSGDPVLLVGVHLAGATSCGDSHGIFQPGPLHADPVPAVQTVPGDMRTSRALART